MPYLSLIRIPGDADELLSDTRMRDTMEQVGPENGLISQTVCRTDEGMLVVNLWESKEGSEAAARNPEVEEIRNDMKVPREQVKFEHYDVEDHRVFSR